MENQIDLVVKIIVDAWNAQVNKADKFFKELTDEQYQNEVSPGRNTGVYLLGHLVAVHDALLPLMGFGEKLHPELEEAFLKNPDKSGLAKASVDELKNDWNEVNKKLAENFSQLTSEEWLQKHTSVNEEDFKKEPYRNRLNVLVSRTNHLANHLGQLVFLK